MEITVLKALKTLQDVQPDRPARWPSRGVSERAPTTVGSAGKAPGGRSHVQVSRGMMHLNVVRWMR